MTTQEFAAVDVLRLQVQEGWPDLPNDVLNPDGTGGAWGWHVTGGPGDPSFGSNDYVELTAGTGVAGADYLQFRVLQDLPVVAADPGPKWVIDIPAAPAGYSVQASVNVLSFDALPTAGEWVIRTFGGGFHEYTLGPLVVGVNDIAVTAITAGTTQIQLFYKAPFNALEGHRVRFRDAWMIHGPTADVTASDLLTDPPWVDVLGSAARIEVERDELNVGILNATLIDSTLDPASTDLIRPGKRCRLETLIDGTWEALFTGKLDAPSTAYVVDDPKLAAHKRVRIQLVASDPAADLANESRTEGVGTLGELSYVLLGTGVPFNINGSSAGTSPANVTIVSDNDQAKAIDQVAITRDSVLGYAWIDRKGVLQAWDADTITTHYPIALANGSFDTDVAGWTGTNATLAHNTATFHVGPGAMRMTAVADGNMQARTPIGTAGIPVVPGASYRVEGYNRRGAVTSRDSRIQLRWYDAAGALVSTTNGTSILNTSAFVLREVEGIAPDTAEYMAISLDIIGATTGGIHYWDEITLGGPVAILDDTAVSDLVADFDVERTFNTLQIELQQINPGTGETETLTFGPYVDEAAKREWRAREATFKVQGLESTDIPTLAAEILTRNARPLKRINSLSLPIRTVAELEERALYDLYDLMGLSSDAAAITSQLSRVTSLKHRIVIKKEGTRLLNRWWIDLGFTADGSVAAPQVTPDPTPGGGRTLGELLRPVGELTMWFGNSSECPAGWLVCDGSAFDPATYPALAAHYDAAGLVGYVLPNFTDRFPIGAGTKLWSSSGGSSTVTINSGNLPPHTHGLVRKAAAGTSTGVARGNGVAETDGTTDNGGFANSALNILNPWRAVWFIIRAA